jgi:hypothetical protein
MRFTNALIPGGREVVPFLTKKSSVEFLVGSGSL